ncbi:MAG: DNA-3-methyladenine glycosylase I [Thermoplasmataceae archaeon]
MIQAQENDNGRKRCEWVPLSDPLYMKYHDEEWGVPLHVDSKILEMIILEGQQAGLSWKTILHKRENLRKAYAHFDPNVISQFDEDDIRRLLNDSGIIRNRSKINAAIQNSRSFMKVQEEFGTFDNYIWRFVNNRTVHNSWRSVKDIPPRTEISDAMSTDLVRRGFKYVGSTICYSHMQATGMVNDHTLECFRYRELVKE